MSFKKKPSGAEYRKRRKLDEIDSKKQAANASKFFKINPDSNNVNYENPAENLLAPQCVPAESGELTKSVVRTNNTCGDINIYERETSYEQLGRAEVIAIETNPTLRDEEAIFNAEDPGTWPENINDKMIQFLIEKGPTQITNFNFPAKNKRKFNVGLYRKIMPNGEIVERSWLIYSVAKDAVFCFCCKLFMKKNFISFSAQGFSDWNHLHIRIKQHEQNLVHIENFKTWKLFSLSLSSNKTIDSSLQIQMSKEIRHWNNVLHRLLILVQFLGSQNLAFRGSSNVLHTQNNGNFLKLVEAISKFDLVLADHLKRITDASTHTTYLSPNIQNELIDITAKSVQNKILKMVDASKYYSIIVDSTPDASRVEQITLIIRFLHRENSTFEIREHFLGFLEGNDKTGLGISETVLKKLNQLGLSINNCRGQGYDNGSNMKGKHSGMQNRIRLLEPRAFYVPCASHTLNLVVNDSAHCSLIAVNFFDTIQCLFVFFSSSTNRWDIFKSHVKELTVKPLSDTRWESRINALKPLMHDLENIYEALVDISDKGDTVTKATANSLGNKLLDFKFICCLVIWNDILTNINIASKYLQNKSVNISTACKLIHNTLLYLEELRSDEKFNEFICIAESKAHSLDVPTQFPNESTLRSRRKKRQSIDECRDERICDPKTSFRIEFYFKILDQAIISVRERFEQLEAHNTSFSFLYDIGILSKNSELSSSCKNLADALRNGQNFDLHGEDLFNELTVLSPLIKPQTPGIEVLEYIYANRLEELFPNCIIALKILLTLPVTVASGERSFSKLKLIKNYLRSTMGQERLVNLSLLSIEAQLVETLEYEELINDFAKLKARRINFN